MKNGTGYLYGIIAYLLWGAFPLYFNLVGMINPFEIIPWRVLTSLVFCLLIIALLRQWKPLRSTLSQPKLIGWFTISSLLLYINWQIFVAAVVSGNILETSLGYFINPLVTILIGVLLRGEKLTRAQWAAVGVAAVGVLVSAGAYGRFPLIALGLAFSFGFYGAVHQHASKHVDALTGLTVETLLVSPLAIAQLAVVSSAIGGLGAFAHGPGIAALLMGAGVVTAVPLLFFGAATRRLPLAHLGFIQFLTPILSFMTGYFIFHEEMPPARWIGFAAVWVSLTILITDTVTRLRREPQP